MARTSFAVAAILASLAAGCVHAETADRRPAFEILVDNRAPDAGPELATAQARVRYIFGGAGIRVTSAARASGPAVPGLERIVVVLLDETAGDRLVTGDVRRLGFAVPPANRVYVHYARVHDLARHHGVEPGWFLGVVMAHELAHVLLPRTGHAEEGIMAPSLTPDPKCPPAFSREEGRLIRHRLEGQTLLALN